MRAFTSIEQSKALAKILPIESADMYYQYILPKSNKIEHTPKHGNPAEALEWYNKGYTKFGKEPLSLKEYCIPCWSLAALLEIIHKDFYIVLDHDGVAWTCNVRQHDHRDIKDGYWGGDPVDACVEMIVKLKEKGLI